MTIIFNVTGSRRKELVGAISQELNAPTKYLGAPTFAYEVGGYHIDKNGTVTGKDNLDLEDVLHQKGFDAVGREYDEPDTYESGLGGMGAVPSFEELQMTEHEELGLGREHRENFQGENGMRADDVPDPEGRTYQAELGDPDCPDRMEVFGADDDEDAIRQAYEFCEGEVVLLELFELDDNYNVIRSVDLSPNTDTLTIEMPLEGFTETALENLDRLIASKAALIKKAIGADALPVERTEATLRFPWFRFGIAPEKVNAYSRFIGALCAAAKEQHRVTAKEKPVDNEKFAFRVFLIRLGFVGDDYKTARKILLKNLSGNSAFKHGAPPKVSEVSADE